jgi:hypothetical protein
LRWATFGVQNNKQTNKQSIAAIALPTLTHLFLDGNKLSDLVGVSSLVSLRHFSGRQNEIKTLDGFSEACDNILNRCFHFLFHSTYQIASTSFARPSFPIPFHIPDCVNILCETFQFPFTICPLRATATTLQSCVAGCWLVVGWLRLVEAG